jgi:UDP-glucose 4-epimerase
MVRNAEEIMSVFEKKRIVVTGGAGFIGSNLCDELIERGYAVTCVDNLSMGLLSNISHHLNNPNFTFINGNVQNFGNLGIDIESVSTIVHLAAFKIPRYGNTLLINSEGLKSVLETAKPHKTKVVLASTSDVYGKSPNLPFREDGDLLIGPSDVKRWSYAVSKLYDEHLGFAYQEAFGIPVVILRFFGSYGPRHHLSWWGGPQSVFIQKILKNEEIEIHGDGLQTRSFTYISDTVRGVAASVELDAANGEIINLGSTHEITILDLAKTIHRLIGNTEPLKLKYVPYSSFSGGKYEDVMRRIPDVNKAKRLLGVQSEVSLEDGLSRTIEWQRKLNE